MGVTPLFCGNFCLQLYKKISLSPLFVRILGHRSTEGQNVVFCIRCSNNLIRYRLCLCQRIPIPKRTLSCKNTYMKKTHQQSSVQVFPSVGKIIASWQGLADIWQLGKGGRAGCSWGWKAWLEHRLWFLATTPLTFEK
jgi:hypothetical protein